MNVPSFLLVDPSHYDVSYSINPWMRPDAWASDPAGHRAEAAGAFASLARALRQAGAAVEIIAGAAGLPDMVFPANGGIVLDGRALVARFRYPERQGEQSHFAAAFERLAADGLIDTVLHLPEACVQEGAGDCIWDAARRVAWTGFGPRSSREATALIGEVFGIETRALELATARFYHLDTCFCPLPGGEVLFYLPAFTEAGLALIRDSVSLDQVIEATDEDASRFCVNAVAFDRHIVMATPTDRLAGILRERGYTVHPVALDPFMLSGGGAYCMTLRLDLRT